MKGKLQTLKWGTARKKNICDDPNWPHVSFKTNWFKCQNFRCNEFWCTMHCLDLLWLYHLVISLVQRSHWSNNLIGPVISLVQRSHWSNDLIECLIVRMSDHTNVWLVDFKSHGSIPKSHLWERPKSISLTAGAEPGGTVPGRHFQGWNYFYLV